MKKFIAFIIDIGISFVLLGYVIAALTGQTTENGFQLEGMPAFILFALIIVYFVVGKKLWGQSLGRKIMKVEPKTKKSEAPAAAPSPEMPGTAETMNQPMAEPTVPQPPVDTPQV